MLTSSVVILHDSACPYTAAHTQAFSWELFDHPPYSLDLTLSDYHLFMYVKNWLGTQCLNNNEELMEGIKMWQSSQAADFFDIGIQKFIP
jgi:histone-lysine N-methyltransferase SETMAR